MNRREFLAGMLVVLAFPKTLDRETLDFQRWEAELPASVKGAPLKVGLLGDGVEISGAGYARQPASFASAVDGVLINDAPIEWPTFTGTFTVDEMALYDRHGNELMRGSLATSYALMPGDALMFQTGKIAVAL